MWPVRVDHCGLSTRKAVPELHLEVRKEKTKTLHFSRFAICSCQRTSANWMGNQGLKLGNLSNCFRFLVAVAQKTLRALHWKASEDMLSQETRGKCLFRKTYDSTVTPTKESNPSLQDMIHDLNKVFTIKFLGILFSYGITLFRCSRIKQPITFWRRTKSITLKSNVNPT